MSRAGRASSLHLRRLGLVPLAIAVGAVIAGCGGAGKSHASAVVKASPTALVSQSVSASDAIKSGRLHLAVTLKLDGVKQLGGKPVTLDVSGPFQRDATNDISTDLRATVSAASTTAEIGIDKVGRTLYLGLGGAFYMLPASAKASPSLGSSGARGILATLGIDPKSWLSDPHIVAGTSSVGGVSTDHLSAQINVPNVLNDLSTLITSTGSTGAGSSSSALAALEGAITAAHVDIYTAVGDHIVRQVDLDIEFTVPPIAAGAVGGLTGGSLKIDATLTELNQPETITAPANPQPSSKLLNGVFALESQFGSLASLVAGASSGG